MHRPLAVDAGSPAAQDLLSLLPLTLPVTDLGGREGIAHPPRPLETGGSPGSDPEDDDLIRFVPRGNLSSHHDATGVGFSDATLHLGTCEASSEQLDQLQGDAVRVEVVG